MRKALFLFMVFGLVGLMCGCEVGTTALSESDISDDYNEEVKKSLRKLISTGNCKECPFVGVHISGRDLSHKDLKGANLTVADLKGANLTGADLTGANLIGADLEDVKLDGAILCHTTMSDGKKVYSNCKNADLTGADLTGADLTGADLSQAKMKNIRNLDSAIKCKTIFSWGEDNSGCK